MTYQSVYRHNKPWVFNQSERAYYLSYFINQALQTRKRLLLPNGTFVPSRTTTKQTYTISGLCLRWVPFQVRSSATGLREAHTKPIFSLGISVLEYHTARNVMQCFDV